MAGDIHDISMLLGDIRASLRALESKVDTNNSRAEADSAKLLDTLNSHDARLDSLASDSRLMRTDVNNIADTVKDSKAVTDDVKRWRQLGIGIIGIVGVGAAWVGANGMWLFDTTMGWLKARLGL